MFGVRSRLAFNFLGHSSLCLLLLSSVSAESVRFRLDATNGNGESLDSITVGDRFYLSTFIEDISAEPVSGAFAAYLDVAFDADLVSAIGPIEYGTYFSNGKKGELLDGVFEDMGGFSSADGTGRGGVSPIGPGEFLLTRVEMEAVSAGNASFSGSFADDSPTLDVLLFGLNEPVVNSDIEFGTLSFPIQAVPEPSGYSVALSGLLAVLLLHRHRINQPHH